MRLNLVSILEPYPVFFPRNRSRAHDAPEASPLSGALPLASDALSRGRMPRFQGLLNETDYNSWGAFYGRWWAPLYQPPMLRWWRLLLAMV